MVKISLFHPNVSQAAIKEVVETLNSKWVAQGDKVDRFEQEFTKKFVKQGYSIATNSGTAALHLAYILAGLKDGDEILAPVFTCTATNIPLLYWKGINIKFVDIQPHTFNIDPQDIRRKITERTKAIVCVHYGGLPCDMHELKQFNLPIIQDNAHALGATYRNQPITSWADFSMFSFQAIKHITTGDGGMLTVKMFDHMKDAKLLRWFGIDREAKMKGIWANDIHITGYKYHMNNIAASLGLASLREFDINLAQRRSLFKLYEHNLKGIPGIKMIGTNYTDREHACWLCTVIAEKRNDLQKKLLDNGIESDPVHYRNDLYSIFFGKRCDGLPMMDAIENNYLALPLHNKMNIEDVLTVCSVIKSGW